MYIGVMEDGATLCLGEGGGQNNLLITKPSLHVYILYNHICLGSAECIAPYLSFVARRMSILIFMIIF